MHGTGRVTTRLEAARAYLQQGLVPIPVGPDKRPLIRWESFQQESPHADQIDAWWTRWPEANIGIVTGHLSGVVVLDADGPEGLESLTALRTPATTWLSRTGRGWHQWFKHPGVTIGNRAGVRPHLDVRGDGGYVVAPPSRHPSGRRYEWLTPPDRGGLAPLPDHVLALLTAPTPIGGPPAGGEIPEGQRNDTLYRLTRSLMRRGLSAGAVHAAVAEENRARCRPALSDHEVRELVAHALRQPHRADFISGTASDDGLGLVSIGELLSETETGPAWIVDQRLPAGGLGIMPGKPKAGKSTLARVLAFHVSRGEPWLGFATTRGPVIYLALEEKRREVRAHFEALGATSADPIYLLCATAPEDALARLRREAERRHPVLIIVDPLFRFVRVPAELGNDYSAMSALLEPLLMLARETGAHVLVVHHLGKGNREGGDAILGSTAIFAAVDTALLVKRGERGRSLSSLQRYGDDLDEITLDFDPVTRDITAGPPPNELEELEARAEILKHLAGRPGSSLTEAELEEAIECRTTTQRRALRQLVADGRVLRTGRGGKGDPFRYSCSQSYVGNMGTRTLFPSLSPGT
jgi:Bifunctional DNA primase/polymerase, N-terminal/AAA domain/Bacterial regulatory proteins, gntR family